jgi:hypothetical protein
VEPQEHCKRPQSLTAGTAPLLKKKEGEGVRKDQEAERGEMGKEREAWEWKEDKTGKRNGRGPKSWDGAR